MSLFHFQFMGILLAILLMWAGNRVRMQVMADEKAGRRWLWFLIIGLGLSIIASIVAILIGDKAYSISVFLLLPVTLGFIATLVIHFVQDRNVSTGKLVLIFLVVTIALPWISFGNGWTMSLFFILVAVITAIAWLMWRRYEKQYLLFFIIEVILLGISIRVIDMHRASAISPEWLRAPVFMGSFLFVPGTGVVLSALLLRRLFSNDQPVQWRTVTSTLLMIAVLFSMIGYQAMLTSIWDDATDGLGWIMMWMLTSIIGIGSAILIAWSLPRKRIWVAILFALAVPSMLVGANNLSHLDASFSKPIIVTTQRADIIDKAIQRYYEKNNEYPQALSDLTPWYLLYIPNPMIIPGQDWCYQGGADHYRFGYVYRRIFSVPASVRIHSSMGETSDTNWECQNEADKYPGY